MKKTVLAAALGIGVSIAPVYGQGYIIFSNHGTTTDAMITLCPLLGGMPLDGSFTAGFFYQFGGGALTQSTTTQPFNSATPGYFQGPIVTIPGYSGGPITFQVVAYNGADYYSSFISGFAAPFTLLSLATGTQPVGEFGPALKPFFVGFFDTPCVPEPSAMALVGLGLVSLPIFGRKDRTAKKD
jgi:hypothetical protein